MIVRTYGRRSRCLTRSCSDDVGLGSQDPFEFDFSSQESLGQWSEESQERNELGIWKSKKVKVGNGSNLEEFGLNSSQDSSGFGGLEWKNGGQSLNLENCDDGFLGKSRKVKIGNGSDLEEFGFNSSRDSGGFGGLELRNGGQSFNSENCDDGFLGKSRKVKIGNGSDLEEFGFNSSQDSGGFGGLLGRNGGQSLSLKNSDDVCLWKSKKVKCGNGSSSEEFGFNLSQYSEGFSGLHGRNGGQSLNLKNSDDGYLGKSNLIKIDDDFDPYGFDSLQDSVEFKSIAGDVPKVKKGKNWKGKENGVLMKKTENGKKTKKKKEVTFASTMALMKKKENEKKSKKKKEVTFACTMVPTVTLMETQEFGEMMEHMDEVNFALDGMRKGQPVRIRRASLLSLLSICGTSQQRRLLRAHGLAKTIIKSILGLSYDDSPSNLAAAALLYVLRSDGHSDHLLDSPSCIRFLIKLLKPLASDAAKVISTTMGSKLLALRADANSLQNSDKGLDLTTRAIRSKVKDILVCCKDVKLGDIEDHKNENPELNPKWISLLTMEKACLSRISIEDTSGIMRKDEGNFKEKLRELGGLDAVFEVARSCHRSMEGWSGNSLSSVVKSKEEGGLESLALLLKCLKIMENSTFLSKENQSHLLEMKGNFDNQHAPRSFVKLVLDVLKILSDVSLRCSLGNSVDENFCSQSCGDVALNKEESEQILSITSSVRSCTLGRTHSQPIFIESQNSQRVTTDHSGSLQPASEETTTSASDCWSLKVRLNSSISTSCRMASNNASGGASMSSNSSRIKCIEVSKVDSVEDSQDPFAFGEEELEPSKWDSMSGRKKLSEPQRDGTKIGEQDDISVPPHFLDEPESSSLVASGSSIVDEKASSLLAECLLSAVKVLMNLTNDNPLGCQQIAANGGLEKLSSVVAHHFPSFSSSFPVFSTPAGDNTSLKSSSELNQQNDGRLPDHEIDLLVSILGLLVNLVEKDGCNRSRLAAASVSLPSFKCVDDKNQGGVIPLLCSIFLANQGAGEVAGEGRMISLDDEDAITQGEKEAEKMIIEAYAALLLAFLSTESKRIRKAIADYLPDHNLAILVPVLERFVEFHLTLNMISPETHTTVLEVIESCRIS